MTRPLAVLLLGLVAFGLGACHGMRGADTSGPTAAVKAAPRLPGILARGELRVGLSGDQPPLNMTTREGELIGLEVDIARGMAEAMGLVASFQTMPFAELLPALESGRVDLVISGMTITPARNARVAFAGPYFVSGKSVLAKSDLIENVESPAALNRPDRTYVALAGSTSEAFVKQQLATASLLTTPDYDSAVAKVLSGEVDGLVADYPICAHSLLRHPDAGLSALTTPFTVEPMGIALPADDALLTNLVQNYLVTLKDTGLLTRYKVKWFSEGDWLSELP